MRRKPLYILIAVALFATIFAMEQVQSSDPFNLLNFCKDILELLLLVGAVAMTAFVSGETRDLRQERRDLTDDLARARRESARFRDAARAHVDGLSRAIATQFRDWSLTEAESDVATFMLKGLSHKEIAALRDCSEPTVRQHAATVYRKANLSGRTQLNAYFLEDLLMPQAERRADASPLVVVTAAAPR